MGIFKGKSDPEAELRNVTERRTREQKWRHDRRVQPDRRLNNISVKMIPLCESTFTPATREASCCVASYMNQAKGSPRNEHSVVCVFKRNKSGHFAELRKVTERRVQQQLRPYNRRGHPDRRLNNISVEWISY